MKRLTRTSVLSSKAHSTRAVIVDEGVQLAYLEALPYDLLLGVLRFLDGKDLCSAGTALGRKEERQRITLKLGITAQVSRRFDYVVNHYDDQTLWRELFEREWPGRQKPRTKTWKVPRERRERDKTKTHGWQHVYFVCLESELILSKPSFQYLDLHSLPYTRTIFTPCITSGRPVCSEYRIIILGDRGTGKSSILRRFATNTYVPQRSKGLEEVQSRELTIDSRACNLEISTWSGQDTYRPLDDQHLLSATGIMFVYSVCDRSSFENIVAYRDMALRLKAVDNVPMVLVGTMNDREDDRVVSRQEGQELGTAMWCPFVEVSARISRNVDQAFLRMVREIRKHHFRVKSPSFIHNSVDDVKERDSQKCACSVM